MTSVQRYPLAAADEGQGNAGVAAGGFEDNGVFMHQPRFLGSFDHAETDAVLDAAAGIEEFQLGDHGCLDALQSGVADAPEACCRSVRRRCWRSGVIWVSVVIGENLLGGVMVYWMESFTAKDKKTSHQSVLMRCWERSEPVKRRTKRTYPGRTNPLTAQSRSSSVLFWVGRTELMVFYRSASWLIASIE